MIDDAGTFAGGAAQEIAEETGLQISASDLTNLTDLALSSPSPTTTTITAAEAEAEDEDAKEEHLQRGVYPSPGGSDEFVPIFLWQKRVPRAQLRDWEGKLTGVREAGERITLGLCPLGELWRVGARDGKALAGWALYEGLRREGRV